MKNIKSFHLFENSSYIDILNKDPKIVEWLLTARFANEYEGFYEYEPIDIITPYGEKISAKFEFVEGEYTGEEDWNFLCQYVDDYGILYEVKGHGRGYHYDTAYDNLEWDEEISNVKLTDAFSPAKIALKNPLILSRIFNISDDSTKESIIKELESSGMNRSEINSLVKGGNLLNRFEDI